MESIGILIALGAGIWVRLDAGKRGYPRSNPGSKNFDIASRTTGDVKIRRRIISEKSF